MEEFGAYSHALVSVAGVCLILLAQNFHVGLMRGQHSLAPDAKVEDDYSNKVFRVFRVFANSVESLPAFVGAVLVAVLVGASPFWVNLFASLHLVLRLVFWWIYVTGAGKPQAGLRTGVFVAGWAMNVAIALMAIFAGLF